MIQSLLENPKVTQQINIDYDDQRMMRRWISGLYGHLEGTKPIKDFNIYRISFNKL